MVKITTNRGTSTDDVEPTNNWTGDDFKKHQKKKLAKVQGEVLTTKRGTDTIKVDDIPAADKKDLTGRKITTKRGTSTETL